MPYTLIAKALGAVAGIFFLWWAWGHYVADPYIAEGVAMEQPKTEAALKRADEAEAANAMLAADFKTLEGRYAAQAESVAALAKKTAVAQAAARAAKAALAAKQAEAENEIERLRAIAAQPPAVTKEADCEDAAKLLDRAAADRLRD